MKQSNLDNIQRRYTSLNDEFTEEHHERWTGQVEPAVEETLTEVYFTTGDCFEGDNVELSN